MCTVKARDVRQLVEEQLSAEQEDSHAPAHVSACYNMAGSMHGECLMCEKLRRCALVWLLESQKC